MADTKAEVRKYFIESVAEHPKASTDLKRMLTQHLQRKAPRIEDFLNKLTAEVIGANYTQLRSGKKPFSPPEVKWVVKEMTNLFVLGIEGEANRRMESDLARAKREQEAARIAEMDSTLEGKAAGAFEEMGVITDEKALGPARDKAI